MNSRNFRKTAEAKPASTAAAAGDRHGLACGNCGCRHFYVRNTIPAAAAIVRYRICRNCGHVKRTREK